MRRFNWEKEAETQWDHQAQGWSKRSMNMWENGSRKNIIPFLQRYIQTGSKLLDVGCGDGYGSLKLAKSGFEVTGVDISANMIGFAKEKVKQEPADFLKADVNDLPFEDVCFDGVMAINVMEWTEDPLHVMNELKRVLMKGGMLCVGILGPTAGPRTNSYQRLYGEKTICNTMMPWEFDKLAQENGLEYVDGFGVYKKGIKENQYKNLPRELKQALSFLWVCMLRKVNER
jgi:ubiquinone/menaquinone biosynthesis C-methylase UbiE